MLIDSHAHLDDDKFNEDRETVLQRAKDAGVSTVINVGCDMPSCHSSILLAEKYPNIYAAVGIHPHDAADITEDDFRQLRQWTTHPKVVAIGEIGLDYYRNLSPKDVQRNAFIRQIALAKAMRKPIIIHDRDAHGDILEILHQEFIGVPGGVMHCYSGSVEMAEEVVKMGLYVSIAGPVTFQNARKLIEVIESIDLKWLLVETDAPYLAPEPFRGRRNESAFVRYTAEKIAEIKQISIEEVAAATTANARKLFNLT